MQLFLLLPWRMTSGWEVLHLGLDWVVLDTVLAWSGITLAPADRPPVLQQLQTLESVARPILNRRD